MAADLDPEKCQHVKDDGEQCGNHPQEDGYCHLDSHGPDEEDEDDPVEKDAGDPSISGDVETEEEPDPGPSYPDPDSDAPVYFDPSGAGEGATTGHNTIHLVRNRQPRCDARVGNRGSVVPRSELSENIDECSACL